MTNAETANTVTTTHRFTISTWADTLSNRGRDRTCVVEASTAAEAKAQAAEMMLRDIRHWVSVWSTITDVDGRGAPVNCPHANSILMTGFVPRWDGGRDCKACGAVATTAAP